MWGRFDTHKQNARLGFLDCSRQSFQVEKEDVARETVTNGSLMLVRLTTLLTTSFTALSRKGQSHDKGKYSHPDDTTMWWAAINPFR